MSLDPVERVAKVALVYAGGTIGMAGDPLAPMPPKAFLAALKSRPGFVETDGELSLLLPSTETKSAKRTRIAIDFVDHLKPIDSSEMTPEKWADIAETVGACVDRTEFTGVVVMHGTDTLAWTASALSFLLGDLRCPVIVTGSQAPLVHTRSDGLRNLVTSIEFAADKRTPGEVCVFFDRRLTRGNRTTKVSVTGFDGFDSPNFAPLGTAGSVIYDVMKPPPLPPLPRVGVPAWRDAVREANVIVHRLHPGARVYPPVRTTSGKLQVSLAVVLEAYGAGTAWHGNGLRAWLRRVRKQGGVIVLRTQVPHGSVDPNLYEAASWLADIGALSGVDITSEACTAKLHYLMATNVNRDSLEATMRRSIRGEVTIQDTPALPTVPGPYGLVERRPRYTEREMISRLFHVIMSASRGAEVSLDALPSRVDLLIRARAGGRAVAVECTVGRLHRDKVAADIARLLATEAWERLLIADEVTPAALELAQGSGIRVLDWAQALTLDWAAYLKVL